MDVDAGLIVDAGGVELLGARGYGGIARNDFCDRAAVGFDAKGERGDVEQQHGFHAAVEDVGLHGGTERDDFIGIQLGVWFAAEKFLHGAADQRGARGATNENDFIHVGGLELRVGKRLLDGPHGAVNHRANQGIEGTAREFVREYVAIRQRETKSGRFGFGKAVLHVDERFAQLLREFAVRREVDFIVLKNQFVDESLQKIVDVVATEVRVAVGGKNLEDIAFGRGNELEDGNVEGAAAEIVDGYSATLLFVESIGEGGGGGLVDEAENVEAGDFASVLGGLALGVVEIGRNGDYGAIYRFAEMSFGPIFQFAENESGNLRRGKNLFAEFYADDVLARWIDAKRKELEFISHVSGAAAHQAFHGIDRAFRLGQKATASWLSNDHAAVGIEADDGRAKRVAVWTGDTLRPVRLRIEVCDETVGRSEIDSDDSAHDEKPQGLKPLRYKSSF